MQKTLKFNKYLNHIVLGGLSMLLYSCQNTSSLNQFPSSSYSNFDIQKSKIDYLIQVNQITDSTFQVIYRDTITASLDSTLHKKVLDLKQNNQRLHEYPTLIFNLDKNLSYRKFTLLNREFRKLFFQKYILKLDNGKHLMTYQFPIQKEENVYLDPRLKDREAPSIFKEFNPYFYQDNYLFFYLENKTIKIEDGNGVLISDYINYVLTHKQFIIFYDIPEKATYQDYIYLISNLMSMQERIREIIEKDRDSLDLNTEDNYKLIILEKNYLPYFKNYHF